jgi:cytochrome c-type biogenesis protein CcmH
MPDLTELISLAVLGLAVGAFVARPLWRGLPEPGPIAGEDDAALIRHRVAVEALRDVEADRRAGSLDDAAYAEQRAEAEARAVLTLAELGAASASPASAIRTGGPRVGLLVGAPLVAALLVGMVLPAPVGLANRTTVDAAGLSALADQYLARNTSDDLARGAALLLALIREQPENQSAYQRLITAYLRAEDYPDAGAATDALAAIAPDSPDLPFFRGLIALRGSGDRQAAIAQFDRFLQLAPDDPRAVMVRALRDSAAAGK